MKSCLTCRWYYLYKQANDLADRGYACQHHPHVCVPTASDTFSSPLGIYELFSCCWYEEKSCCDWWKNVGSKDCVMKENCIDRSLIAIRFCPYCGAKK